MSYKGTVIVDGKHDGQVEFETAEELSAFGFGVGLGNGLYGDHECNVFVVKEQREHEPQRRDRS